MFLTVIEDSSDQQLVTFYCTFTAVYFGAILATLHSTDTLFSLGKYQFSLVISIIAFFECVKYFTGKLYYSKNNQPIIGRADPSSKKNYTKNKVKDLIKCACIMVAMLVVYYVMMVLFGAQVFSKQEETLMLSFLLCVLTIFPACLNLGSQSVMYLLLGMKPCVDILGISLLKSIQLSLLGCWLGAFVIPLDWDRPWQVWPISCGIGAMIGYFTSNIFVLGLIYTTKYQQSTEKSGRKVM